MVEVEAWRSVGVMPVALWLILFASSSDVCVEGCTAGSVGGGSGGLGSRSSFFIGGGGFGFWASYRPSNVGIAIAVTAMAGIALAATLAYSNRGSLKSPWSRRRRKHALLRKQWKSLFDPDGRFSDGGIKFLKKVRSGGVDPSIRAEVWPFLLGVYALNSSMEERDFVRTEKRKDYENLRSRCMEILRCKHQGSDSKEMFGNTNSVGSGNLGEIVGSSGSDARDLPSAQESCCLSADNPLLEGDEKNSQPASEDTESSVSESCVELESIQLLFTSNEAGENDGDMNVTGSTPHMAEDFSTWQRIIRLDALRANSEWTTHSLAQATVSEMEARNSAASVGLVDFDQLEPYQILHAARLVAILEAYALHDPEIGYCQGMSDLLSPIIAVIEDDGDAFWCFAGFMRKARHNFRLDEVGIRRQLTIVSKIIQLKDAHLYQHLEKLQASDCCFVYRMVVVLFRRELSFEQTLCLWEVMWADQVAVRAGFGKASWGRMRLRAPPTDDLLLYAIAACVLQRRKLIIEKYSSMEEIMRECNGMAGRLDVWKLLDDAHDLVVSLQDKDIQQASS